MVAERNNVKKKHISKLRVRYAETDAMRVVYYSEYFVWFEVGRVDMLRSRGFVYRDLEKMDLTMPVVEASANYFAPARFDDEIVVQTWVSKIGRSSMRFDNEVYKMPDETLLCKGHTVHVLIDKDRKPVPIPKGMRATLSA